MRSMYVAGFEMQRSAGLVLLAFIREVALDHVERLGHTFVEVFRNDRAWLHDEVQHHRPERVVRVADRQRDITLTREGETIGLELTFQYFLVDHVILHYFAVNPTFANAIPLDSFRRKESAVRRHWPIRRCDFSLPISGRDFSRERRKPEALGTL